MSLKAMPVVAGVSRGGIGVFGSIIGLALKNIKWFLFIIAIFIVTASAIVDCFKERSIMPFVYALGGRVFMADTQLKQFVLNHPINTSVWGSFYTLIQVLSMIWITIMLIIILAKLIGYSPISNDSNKFINFALAILFLYILQMTYCLSFNEDFGLQEKDCYKPFPGMVTLITNIDDLFAPIKDMSYNLIDVKLDNQTIMNTSNILLNYTGVENGT